MDVVDFFDTAVGACRIGGHSNGLGDLVKLAEPKWRTEAMIARRSFLLGTLATPFIANRGWAFYMPPRKSVTITFYSDIPPEAIMPLSRDSNGRLGVSVAVWEDPVKSKIRHVLIKNPAHPC